MLSGNVLKVFISSYICYEIIRKSVNNKSKTHPNGVF